MNMKTNFTDPHFLLFSDRFLELVKPDPVGIIDVGARGELMHPWSLLPRGAVNVTGFEPDLEECDRLTREEQKYTEGARRRYLPYALWSHDGHIQLHVGAGRGASSVHPPYDELLRKFHPRHKSPRRTENMADVKCNKLNTVVAKEGLSCDFIKLDTQGSEYEILDGAKNVLRDNTFGFLAETWTNPIHKDQFVTKDVMQIAEDMGFTLFSTNPAANWTRWPKEELDQPRRQTVGLDLLYFKEYTNEDLSQLSALTIVKHAAIAEIYGFPDFSMNLLERYLSIHENLKRDFGWAVDAILYNAKWHSKRLVARSKFRNKLRIQLAEKLGMKTSKMDIIAPLH